MKKFFYYIKNNNGQAMVEYAFFTLILLIASYGMVRLFILAWKHKFEFIALTSGVVSVLF